MTKKIFFSMILFLYYCTIAMAEAFYYPKYNVDVTVHADNSYSVTETMHAFFTEKRHGIVRDFSSKCYVKRQIPDGNGNFVEKVMCYSVDFENLKVSENYEEQSEDSYYSIRIGSEDVEIEGDHDYVISYDYRVGDDRTKSGDLFYYSLLGSANETNVDDFTFTIRFDRKVPQEYLSQLKLFYGREGNETNKAQTALSIITDSLLAGEVKGLKANESVTVFLPLPEHYYDTIVNSFDGEDKDDEGNGFNYMMTVVIVMMVLVLLRLTKSRNNFTKNMVAWPPKDLSSADLGYIYDTTVDPCDKISLVPYFAHKGYLAVDVTSGHPVLHKKADLPKDAPGYQKLLFDGFFGKGDSFDTEKPTKHFASKWLDMDDAIKKANKGMDNKYAITPLLLSFASYFLTFLALVIYDITDNGDAAVYAVAIMMLLGWIGGSSLIGWDASAKSRIGRVFLVGSWVLSVVGQVFLISEMLEDDCVFISPDKQNVLMVVYAMMLGSAIFAFRFSSMSKQRLKYIGDILGLKEFIEQSEKPMLDSLLQEHETYFYDILPYAVAFGLAEKWAEQFKELNVREADWFVSEDRSLSNLVLWNSMNHMYSPAMSSQVNKVSEARLAAQAKSSASSHSSGGISGGGFGGGGSHSW